MNNNCQKIEQHHLNRLLVDELPANQQREIEAHLDDCPNCQHKLESLVAGHEEWEKAQRHLANSDEIAPKEWMVNQPTVAIKLSADELEIGQDAQSKDDDSTTFYEQYALDQPTHPEMLGRIDDFEIEKVIGRGGCGVVYKAFDRELNRPVAIKVLAPQLASSGIARQRFAREARAAAAVVHPNVVPIHSVSSEEKRPYIVMSLVNGRSLDAHVRQNGPFELKDIVRISHQIAAGLGAAHRQGLIHRDIKPANVLLEQDVSRVMITDFGLARAADDAAITQTGWLAGTPHYMSPEQASGDAIDQRSDLFSLGSLIYFIATGREPFRAEKPFAVIQKIINETPAKPRRVNADVSKTLEQIIERLLAKNPRDRFQSAEAVQQTLEQYLAHLQNPLASPKPKKIKLRKRLSHPQLVFLASMLLLLVSVWFSFQVWVGGAGSQALSENSVSAQIGNSDAAEQMRTLLSDDDLDLQIQKFNDDISRLESELTDEDVFFTETVANRQSVEQSRTSDIIEVERQSISSQQDGNQTFNPRGSDERK